MQSGKIQVGLVVLLLVCANCLFAQTRTDLMSKELIVKNKVEKVSQRNHSIVNGKVSSNGYVSVITTYDERGNVLLVENMKSNGKKSSTYSYTYDNKDNKISYEQHQLIDGKWSLSYKQTFTYDAKGNKLVEDGFDGKTNYKINHEYYPNGKLKSITKINSFGRVDEKWQYEYVGNATKIKVYKPETKIDRILERKYDVADNLIEESTLKDGGGELGKNLFTFNKNGKMSIKQEYYAGALKAKYEYIYSNNGNLIEVYQTPANGARFLFSAYKYDGAGNLTEERWYDGQPDDYSSREIQLDDKGNVNQVQAYYSDYKYKVVYRYDYKFRK